MGIGTDRIRTAGRSRARAGPADQAIRQELRGRRVRREPPHGEELSRADGLRLLHDLRCVHPADRDLRSADELGRPGRG